MTNLSLNEKDFLKNSLQANLRFDGRGMMDHRKMSISFGSSFGSVEISLGDTKVQSKITATLEEPKKERPNEGILKFKVDLSMMAFHKQGNSVYDKDKYSNEISKVLERVIKGSKAIDVDSLSVLSGKCVWAIQVDLTLLNNDGNLIDTFYLAAIISLIHFRKPHISVESMSKVVVHDYKEKKPHPLSIHHIPILFTFAFFNQTTSVVMDPTRMEEEVMDGRASFAVNIYKDICNIHKPGNAPVSKEMISQLLDVCFLKVGQVTKLIREVIKDSEKYSVQNSKHKFNVDLQWDLNEKIGSDFLVTSLDSIQKVEMEINEQELQETLDKVDQNQN